MSTPRDPEPMSLLVVLPILTHEYADICVDSILMPNSAAGLLPEEILVVDNTREGTADKYGLRTHRDPDGHNLGTARAWNIGAREVMERGLDYLVICSASMRFGPLMHTAFSWQLREFWGAKVIQAEGHAWHLIALHRTCFERVGLFDTNFHCYFEAEEWCLRLRLVGWEHGFVPVWLNAMSQGVALHAPSVSCPAEPLLAYRRDKWGGDKGFESFVLPWGNKPMDYFEDVPIPVLAERYGWETWW
jgi:hypothetical protein